MFRRGDLACGCGRSAWIGLLCGGVVFLCALADPATAARAQDDASGDASGAALGAAAGADLTRFDKFNERGWNIPHPSVADTLVGDAFGIRSTLADAGFGFYGFSSPDVFEYDLSHSNLGKPIAVNGQVGTWNNAAQFLSVTFDTGKIGLEGGQFVVLGALTANSLQKLNNPDVVRVGNLAYNQFFDGGKVFIQVGYYANALHFVGPEVGGSLATGVLGPQAVIPYEVGLSYHPFGAPAAEIKLDLGGGFYDRASVQRSLAPGGGNVEALVNPGAGLKFAPTGTNALYIDEFGYQKNASTSQPSIWFRAGGIYNTTQYKSFTNGRGMDNWALYVLADRQVTSPDKAQPHRGFYLGASAMYAPPLQNLFSQYYEVRAYEFGPFDARPEDFMSVVVSYETYSNEGQRALAPPPTGSFPFTVTGIGSYAFRVRPGLYVQPGLGVTTHPSVSRLYNNSVDAYLALNAFF